MRWIIITILLTLLATGCRGRDTDPASDHGMYYWNTTFSIDSIKSDFIKRHGVKRIYLRMFDVVPDKNGQPTPNATINLGDTIAECPVPVVPTVYILNECMKHPDDSLPQRLLRRVIQMCETHGLTIDGEIQIDCDWTASTRANLYNFMSLLRNLAHSRGLKLSSTIRLHQLSQPVPPVDAGVLMVYNTGDLTRLDVDKPILDPEDVKPYLKYLPGYKLPLAAAYPIYRWDVLFRRGKFVDIIHSPGEIPVLSTDSVAVRVPTVDDILTTKKMIESTRPDIGGMTILYDLNNYNISRFTNEDFENFFD